MKCKWCGFTCNDHKEFENHLLNHHFLSYQSYSEIELTHTDNEDSKCLKCLNNKPPLSSLYKDYYYLPCWDCFSKISKKIDKLEIINSLQRNVKSFLDYFLGDRYFQLFSVDPIYINSTYSHDYPEFKKVLGLLKLPSRNDIWFIDWNIGYPKIISPDNIKGLKIVNLTDKYNVINNKDSIEINNYKILLPEESTYDRQHFSRYNIINVNNSDKKGYKKIKLESGCYKLYNTSNSTRSIFKLIDKISGEYLDVSNINYQDYIVIKLILMRNKNFMRLAFSIIQELIKNSREIRDSVFFKNTLTINPQKDLLINLSWDNKINLNNYINISML